MKKFYQIISTVALSALVMGATAQNASPGHFQHALPAHNIPAHVTGNKTARVLSGPSNVLLDYVNGDEVNNPLAGNGFYYWTPPMYSNVNYTLKDTTFSPLTSARANIYTAQYSTVLFDTCWDAWSEGLYTPTITSPSTVDTIWAQMAYKNSSTKNDTVDFEVVAVNAAGFPTGTVYGTAQVIFNVGSPLPYNNLDSVQTIEIPCNIVIPNTARQGWNFAINFKVHGSKSDTVGLWYYSTADICLYAYCQSYTTMGVVDGRAPSVNSLVTGNMWFNDLKNHGNAQPVIFPNIPPASASNFPGMCANTGGYYYYDQIGCSPDSDYYYVQNLALFASISFNMVTGVQQLATDGFQVSQNYPNPCAQSTQIGYNLAKESDVVFTINDMAGRELMNTTYSTQAAGKHVINLDVNKFTPGVYLYTLNVNGVKVTKRMIIAE